MSGSASTGDSTVVLRHGRGETAIHVGEELLVQPPASALRHLEGRTVFFLSTPRLRELHPGAESALREAAGRAHDLEAQDGESAKRIGVAERLWREMVSAGGKRDSVLVAIGGGSVNDLGGFVAGCFLRGISVVQVPTTLLAQVDAAIGGKTAVDLETAKNSVGLFHHPEVVLSDVSFLATLPAGELRSGLVEAIKMAALLDLPLFEEIESSLPAILSADPGALAPVVAGAARAKVGVVEADPEEAGWRRVLNYGHTLAHAIETALAYQGLRHGEAVAYGMLFAGRLAAGRGAARSDLARVRDLLARLELPQLPPLDGDLLLSLCARDKKASEKGLTWVLPRGLGDVEMTHELESRVVEDELRAFLADPWA